MPANMLPGPRLVRPGHCASANARGCRPHPDAARPRVQNPVGNCFRPSLSPFTPREPVLSVIPKTAVLDVQRLAKVLLVVLKVPFPAISVAESAMKELVRFFAWHLEADKVFS